MHRIVIIAAILSLAGCSEQPEMETAEAIAVEPPRSNDSAAADEQAAIDDDFESTMKDIDQDRRIEKLEKSVNHDQP